VTLSEPSSEPSTITPAAPTAPVTVAVVSWNTRELLAECLNSLERDARSGIADVWVVDNASDDGSADLVERRFEWVSLIRSSRNLGFGPAVNLVAARTSSAWLAPANADVRVTEGALRRLLSEGDRHPEAAVIAPRLLLPDGETQHSVYPFPSLTFTIAYVCGAVAASGRLARRWCMDRGFDPSTRREVPWAVGAFLLVRRAAWDEIGGFDEQQWMYAEDVDLGWRLRRAGWTARFEPQAHVHHSESASTRQAWGEQRHTRWHASTYAWLVRRRGPAFAHTIAAVNVAGFLLRAAILSPLALAGSGRARRGWRFGMEAARAHSVGLRSSSALLRVR
jgi:N-acetylglucosaminyl-diphospho-decaprenol L-rhamnosyltransferase